MNATDYILSLLGRDWAVETTPEALHSAFVSIVKDTTNLGVARTAALAYLDQADWPYLARHVNEHIEKR